MTSFVMVCCTACQEPVITQREVCSESSKIVECVLDSQPHSVCIDDCRDSEDCPIGAACVAKADGDGFECRVPAEALSSRDRLLSGFDVPEFKSSLTNEGPPVLDWSAPDGSRLVSCALFICPPVVELIGREPGRREIINFDRCAVAFSTSGQPDGSFDPRSPEFAYQPNWRNNAGVSDDCRGTGKASLVAEFLVGCWAYDDYDLIGATKLHSLAADEVYDFRDSLARDAGFDCLTATPGKDANENYKVHDVGRTCVLSAGSPALGTCEQESKVGLHDSEDMTAVDEVVCLPRCLRDDDCLDDVAVEEKVKCCLRADEDLKSSYLGVCGVCDAVTP